MTAPLAVMSILVALFSRGLYRTDWQHFSLHEIRAIVTGTLLGLVVTLILLMLSGNDIGRRYGLGAVALGTTVLMLAGSRLFVRSLADALLNRSAHSERLLVYGAGQGGELALRELRSNHALGKTPVGFIDDDPARVGMTIHGIPVLGRIDDLPLVAGARRIDGIVVSTRKLSAEREARLRELAQQLDLRLYHLNIGVVAVNLEPEESTRHAPEGASMASGDRAVRHRHLPDSAA
jgi:UDP-GlcNAc:undecaprenyl-phosphate GlcNAc-1-phosphate transferase